MIRRREALACVCLSLSLLVVSSGAQTVHQSAPGSGAGKWWNDAVCYEIFVRSFMDSDGDGIGDLKGLTSRLDYINDGNPKSRRDLGANCVWLMPIAKSVSYHGYDVTDYYHVNPPYGTDEDFKRFVSEAHRRGIRVIVDFVPNHTSSEHPFFQSALRDTASPYRSWYRWSKTKPEQNGPSQQQVWHKSPVRDEYYYGLFWGGMPDLNYETPAVRREMEKVAAYWVKEMGVDGLRVDAAAHLVEEGGLMAHAPGTHRALREWASALRRAAPNAFSIGEVWADSTTILASYFPDQLDAFFDFTVAAATMDAADRGTATAFLDSLRQSNALLPSGRWAPLLTNHDMTRVMTKFRGDEAKARIAATAMLLLPGIPFVYYGEEIGMIGDKPDEQIRNPMQWSGGSCAGFTRGKPWEEPQKDWRTKNVAAQEHDPGSLLNLYRQLIHLRLAHPALSHGLLSLARASDSSVASFIRQAPGETVVVVLNFGARSLERVEVKLPSSLCGQSCRFEQLSGGHSVGITGNGASLIVRHLAPRQGYTFRLLGRK
jgi:alpha-amylase